MRKIVWLFLLLIFISFGYWFINESKPPSPRITVEGKNIPTAQGSYCWDGFFNNMCVDMISPPQIVEHEGLAPVVVPPGAQLKIDFQKEPTKGTLGVNKWMSNHDVKNAKLNGNILTVPKEKGIHIYDVHASWDKGDSSYVFVIEVQ
ncbi:hypothetical protein HNQ34_002405 [Anoxybacillus tepidamans]|uniref:Uncharacterized protein n=1 Tax=Anoxybacteroides tepidamans TaxID=265948 RepID=A0A7W8MX55_9BACL|nr:hypothetical protein [Anoxybacillus tepidamans]MBB5325305.1 hypothetical protein [Anoxybacillus tepidamans]